MNKNERIELHCHSKAGGSGTMFPGELLSAISDAGIGAFAITDESVVGAYPELEQVWATGNYKARPIFGMEMLVSDVENSIYSISVLIRDEVGKKNLFGIISANSSDKPHPVYELDDLLLAREGLLIGSGNESGRLYHAALSGASHEELKQILSIVDYVEVLPGDKYIEAIERL